eukprot:1835604-Pyramimonas_sp.AAC.1
MNREFTDQEIKVARCAELSRLDEFKAKGGVYRAAVDGPLLSVVWVDETRAEGVKSRICVRPFNMPNKPKDLLYTPPQERVHYEFYWHWQLSRSGR